MQQLYKLQYIWRRLFRHGGHCVHSPFAYEMLTRVVEEQASYYFYDTLYSLAQHYRVSRQRVAEACFLYRLSVHYPICEIRYDGNCPLLHTVAEQQSQQPSISPEKHAYGPFLPYECYRLIIAESTESLPSEREMEAQPTLLYISTWNNRHNKTKALERYRKINRGIAFDLCCGVLIVTSPNLHRRVYKSSL